MTQEESHQQHFIEGIDSDVPFEKLLSVADRERLVGYAVRMLGCDVRLVSPEGVLLAGKLEAPAQGRQPLRLDFEPVAFVECENDSPALAAVCELLDWWLGKQLKYLLAATMHHAVVEDDYRELQRRNQQLEASEARYRELAEQLEQRVQAQVKTIKSAERKLYQNEKLLSVGKLAAGMAHEINNPISFVSSNLSMAAEYVEQLKAYTGQLESLFLSESQPQEQEEIAGLYQDFDDLLQESKEGCDRVTAIVKNLKDFSNVDGTEQARVSVNDLIERVCALYRSQMPEGVELILKLTEVPLLTLLEGHLAQVFSNLLLNARQAVTTVERSGRISISSALEGEQVVIRVSDNGCGMDAETQLRAFDPFYTTHDVGQGIGLGLAVCRDIVAAHRGEIALTSQPGRGTVVTIKLPIAGVQ